MSISSLYGFSIIVSENCHCFGLRTDVKCRYSPSWISLITLEKGLIGPAHRRSAFSKYCGMHVNVWMNIEEFTLILVYGNPYSVVKNTIIESRQAWCRSRYRRRALKGIILESLTKISFKMSLLKVQKRRYLISRNSILESGRLIKG